MLRYQSEATALLQTELSIASSRRVGYITTVTSVPRSREVLYAYLGYESTVAARLKLSVEFDKKTDPNKYSGLGLSMRRMRYTRSMRAKTAPLDADLVQYRQRYGVCIGRE